MYFLLLHCYSILCSSESTHKDLIIAFNPLYTDKEKKHKIKLFLKKQMITNTNLIHKDMISEFNNHENNFEELFNNNLLLEKTFNSCLNFLNTYIKDNLCDDAIQININFNLQDHKIVNIWITFNTYIKQKTTPYLNILTFSKNNEYFKSVDDFLNSLSAYVLELFITEVSKNIEIYKKIEYSIIIIDDYASLIKDKEKSQILIGKVRRNEIKIKYFTLAKLMFKELFNVYLHVIADEIKRQNSSEKSTYLFFCHFTFFK